MKIRVTLNNETSEDVSSDGQIGVLVEHGVLMLEGVGAQWLATFGPGCWLSAVKVADED